MNTQDIPTINACLNGTAAILLALGRAYIKRGNRGAHRNCMIGAFSVSCAFLVGYVTHKILIKGVHTPFSGPAVLRPFYLGLLLSHTILAAAIVPLALITLSRALRERFDAHKRIARWTWPIWMYVSVTGVVVYLVLYQIFPAR
jgi:putative membrane protein